MTETKTRCVSCGGVIREEDCGGLPLGSDYPGELVHDNDGCIAKARERIDGEREVRKEVGDALEVLFRRVNGSSSRGIEMLARHMTARVRTEHRTLQQGLMAVLKILIENYSEFDSDLRNQDAVEWAKKVREAGRDSYLRFI
jgi:hypothetical protein